MSLEERSTQTAGRKWPRVGHRRLDGSYGLIVCSCGEKGAEFEDEDEDEVFVSVFIHFRRCIIT